MRETPSLGSAGDEFCDRSQRNSTIRRIPATTAQQVIDAVKLPFDIEGRAVSVGISIGIALGPQDSCNPDQLFKNADIALYRAKAAGRSTYRYYEPEMDAAIAERNALELDLREAVRLGEFELYYQPIIRLENDMLSGFEALMRWRSPSRGLVSPGDFIPLAEEIGLVVQLGAWALKDACCEAAGWPGDLKVAVNASTVQFGRTWFGACCCDGAGGVRSAAASSRARNHRERADERHGKRNPLPASAA